MALVFLSNFRSGAQSSAVADCPKRKQRLRFMVNARNFMTVNRDFRCARFAPDSAFSRIS
jgi:hypothetical protein